MNKMHLLHLDFPKLNQSNRKHFVKVRGGVCMEHGAVPWTVQIQVKEKGRYRHR